MKKEIAKYEQRYYSLKKLCQNLEITVCLFFVTKNSHIGFASVRSLLLENKSWNFQKQDPLLGDKQKYTRKWHWRPKDQSDQKP